MRDLVSREMMARSQQSKQTNGNISYHFYWQSSCRSS